MKGKLSILHRFSTDADKASPSPEGVLPFPVPAFVRSSPPIGFSKPAIETPVAAAGGTDVREAETCEGFKVYPSHCFSMKHS